MIYFIILLCIILGLVIVYNEIVLYRATKKSIEKIVKEVIKTYKRR